MISQSSHKYPFKKVSVIIPYIAVVMGLIIAKNAWVALGLYHFGIAVLIISERQRITGKIWTGWNTDWAIITILISAMILPVFLFLWKYMQIENSSLDALLINFGLQGSAWFAFMVYFSTVQPLLEEMYWRGYLEQSGTRVSWVDCSFAGYHLLVLRYFMCWYWLLAAFTVLVLVSYIWRYIARKYNGLLVPLLSHIVADTSIIVITFILRH